MGGQRPGLALLFLLNLGFAASSSIVAAASLPFVKNLACPGTYWISLPDHSANIRTAEDLCAAIPDAIRVAQRFPLDLASTEARDWTYDCEGRTCTRSALTLSLNEPGCPASACFCVNPGEGFEVTVSAPSSFEIAGCESRDLITLPPGGKNYLVSVPFQTNLVSWNDLAIATGLPTTGSSRAPGSICRIARCTSLPAAT